MTTSPARRTDSPFARAFRAGLDGTPRRLPSKFFYDEAGDALFQQIMAMPEYYLTDCEREIFSRHAPAILSALDWDRPFDLIELGAGDGTKTQFLIEHFRAAGREFRYRPIDISGNALRGLSERVLARWHDLDLAPIEGDYFDALTQATDDKRPKLVLFPGANIGNFSPQQAEKFLARLGTHLRPGDKLLIGFDLKKDPATILAAYNDPAGITAAFNLNLLRRANRELGTDFQLDHWQHWETYGPVTGQARSYLVSRSAQTVSSSLLGGSWEFTAWEAIHVEVSQKYAPHEIAELAAAGGFRPVADFRDARAYFVDALWVWKE
ncbi:MAG: L-histidine N(alpha)-methyltransferase [Saprospiraceae bacterium]